MERIRKNSNRVNGAPWGRWIGVSFSKHVYNSRRKFW